MRQDDRHAAIGRDLMFGYLVASSGGKAIPVALDLLDDDAIAALFAQVRAEQGRLDVLVNNAMVIPDSMTSGKPFWEKPLAEEWQIWDSGARAAFIAAHHAGKIMVPQKSGLIVGMSGYVGTTYTYDVVFGTTKAATDRMMRDMGVELRPHGVCAVSLWQGFTYTERAVENLKTVPGMASANGYLRWYCLPACAASGSSSASSTPDH